ncbi:MAG: 3-deoxy-7-phosphoheptulonate synthase [Elusimicrobia bacterium]|nr:3-deoxy-7-phosphoheptulonate synthase [Elusimicrobiota bacterium]
MILTLKPKSTKKDIDLVCKKIKELGFKPHISQGKEVTIIGVIGPHAILKKDIFESMDAVAFITPISKPYKLVSREFKKNDTVVKVGNLQIGSRNIIVAAGPCSVETEELLVTTAKVIKNSGAKMIRGGAFKPRTSPYAFQGLGEKGLKYLYGIKKNLGLPVITEVMNVSQVGLVSRYADVIQIGARNMQNFDLLKKVGKIRKPVLLKRGLSATIEEFLMSAEYILSEGNYDVILCERGIRTFETATRFTLDLNAVPAIKKLSHLPVFVDPSHGVGVRDYVPAMCKAAVACGADGLMVEVHPHPEKAFSDGPQSLLPQQFDKMMSELKSVAKAVGRKI